MEMDQAIFFCKFDVRSIAVQKLRVIKRWLGYEFKMIRPHKLSDASGSIQSVDCRGIVAKGQSISS